MDKEWLDRVYRAAKYYEDLHNVHFDNIHSFVKWLYNVYGVEHPDLRKVEKKDDYKAAGIKVDEVGKPSDQSE